jgi:thioredoxin 1
MKRNVSLGSTAVHDARKDGILQVTDDTFDTLVLDRNGPIVVEFMSYGCSHCRAIEPVLQEIAVNPNNGEAFFRVNIALDRELAESYEIMGTPTLVMFLNGAEVGRAEGPTPTLAGVEAIMSEAFAS